MLPNALYRGGGQAKVLKPCSRDVSEPFLLNFLMLVTDKGRIGLIHEMCQAYKEQYYFENGIVECWRSRQCR